MQHLRGAKTEDPWSTVTSVGLMGTREAFPMTRHPGCANLVGNTPPTSVPGESAVCHVGGFSLCLTVVMDQHKPIKPHKSFEEQLAVLKGRGLMVQDEGRAIATLERLGYYRLSGYFYALRQTKPVGQPGRLDTFVDGASFELVVELAEFDKRLRLLALDAIETVEIAVRVAIAYRLGKLDPEAHLHAKTFDKKFTSPSRDGSSSKHQDWLKRFTLACDKSREDFLSHHNVVYGNRIPIWVAIELWDFGLLSHFVSGMQHRDQAAIAAKFGLVEGKVLQSWMRSFNFIRNVAAHHSRLWNRTNTSIPLLPPFERCRLLASLHRDQEARGKVYGALTCLRLMQRSIAPSSDWHVRLKEHVNTFPKSPLISIMSAGFPSAWESEDVWI